MNGTTSMRLNNGKIQNSGFEIEVGSAINITPNISWNGTLRLSYNKNKTNVSYGKKNKYFFMG